MILIAEREGITELNFNDNFKMFLFLLLLFGGTIACHSQQGEHDDLERLLTPDLNKPPQETMLAGIIVNESTLETARKLHGNTCATDPKISEACVWFDPMHSIYLEVLVHPGPTISSITLSRDGPKVEIASTLKNDLLQTGKGLRLGDPIMDARNLYGQPDRKADAPKGFNTNAKTWTYVGWVLIQDDDPNPAPIYLHINFDSKTSKIIKIGIDFGY